MNVIHVRCGKPWPKSDHEVAVEQAKRRHSEAIAERRRGYEETVRETMAACGVSRADAVAILVRRNPEAAAFLLQPVAATEARHASTEATAALAKPSTPSTTPAGATKTPVTSTSTAASYPSWISGWRFKGTLHNGFGPRAGTPGARPAPARPASTAQDPADDGEAIEDFEDRVAALEAEGKTRAGAVRQVVKEDPALHRRYLEQYNARHGRGNERKS